jgi:hypothetical protein
MMMLLCVLLSIVSSLLLAGAVAVNETGDMWYLEYPSGAIYAGEMHLMQRHGVGSLQLPDGKAHFGEWRNDQMHGLGFEEFPDGSALISRWDSDELEGPTFYISAEKVGVFALKFESCSCVVSGWIHLLTNREVYTPLSWKWLVCFVQTVVTLFELERMVETLQPMSQTFFSKVKRSLREIRSGIAQEEEEIGSSSDCSPARSLGAPRVL